MITKVPLSLRRRGVYRGISRAANSLVPYAHGGDHKLQMEAVRLARHVPAADIAPPISAGVWRLVDSSRGVG
jgi:hypothetical protein